MLMKKELTTEILYKQIFNIQKEENQIKLKNSSNPFSLKGWFKEVYFELLNCLYLIRNNLSTFPWYVQFEFLQKYQMFLKNEVVCYNQKTKKWLKDNQKYFNFFSYFYVNLKTGWNGFNFEYNDELFLLLKEINTYLLLKTTLYWEDITKLSKKGCWLWNNDYFDILQDIHFKKNVEIKYNIDKVIQAKMKYQKYNKEIWDTNQSLILENQIKQTKYLHNFQKQLKKEIF